MIPNTTLPSRGTNNAVPDPGRAMPRAAHGVIKGF